jgi:YHS domain-containing protein
MIVSRVTVVFAFAFFAACGGTAPTPVVGSGAPSPASSTTSVAAPSDATIVAPGDAKIGDKTNCPVSGEDFVVTADSPKVEYQGKTYFMCCPGCAKKFAKEPEKYLSK